MTQTNIHINECTVEVQNIIKFVTSRSWFEFEENDIYADENNPQHNSNTISFATRENGNVGDEQYGQADWEKAAEIICEVKKNFEILKAERDTCDEWVYVRIFLKV